jgi:hypothetical protein
MVPTFSSLKGAAEPVQLVDRASCLVSPGALHSSPVLRFVKTTWRISVHYSLLGVARNVPRPKS